MSDKVRGGVHRIQKRKEERKKRKMENLTGCYGGLCNVSNLFQNETREVSIEEELDPFAMPTWRKVTTSQLFFVAKTT